MDILQILAIRELDRRKTAERKALREALLMEALADEVLELVSGGEKPKNGIQWKVNKSHGTCEAQLTRAQREKLTDAGIEVWTPPKASGVGPILSKISTDMHAYAVEILSR